MRFLKHRDLRPESMDQPGLDCTQHHAALDGLHRVNLVSGVAVMMWWRLKKLAAEYSATRPMRVLDLACGGGDVAIQLAIWAKDAGVPINVQGCDFSPTAIRYAQCSASRSKLLDVTFFQFDVLREPIPDGFDVVICSLFLHHLTEIDAKMVLEKMAKAAQKAVLVDDLLRSYIGFFFCCVGSRVLSRSRIVHDDGLQSVRAAFTMREVRELAQGAGLQGAKFKRRWPERFFMSWISDRHVLPVPDEEQAVRA